jgi:uncharacterized protein GlcG (DUF336 family)
MVNLIQAKKAIELSEAKAKELGIMITTTIVDEHGTLVAVSRMDGAIPVSPDISFSKAYTSAVIGVPSMGLAEYSMPGKPYFGVQNILGGKITSIAGGQPITKEGKTHGAVGVGGSMDVSQDDMGAQAALAAFA